MNSTDCLPACLDLLGSRLLCYLPGRQLVEGVSVRSLTIWRCESIDQPYLVDVGFGDAFLEPLRLAAGIEQNDPRKTFLLTPKGTDWLVRERTPGGTWKALYLFNLVSRRLEDFIEMCQYHQDSPESHFTQGTVCSIATAAGRVTISGDRFIETQEGHRTERLIQNETELRILLAEHFRVTDIDRDLLPKRNAAPEWPVEKAAAGI
jgi:N-hydroxyarylamine O-acetyltransferase